MTEINIDSGVTCVSCPNPLENGSVCEESACKHLYCEFCSLMLGERKQPLKYLHHCMLCDAPVTPHRTVTVKIRT